MVSGSVVSNFLQPMDGSPPSSSAHGIFQARILEWVAFSSSKRASWPRDRTCISYIGRQILYYWATREGWGGYSLNNLNIDMWKLAATFQQDSFFSSKNSECVELFLCARHCAKHLEWNDLFPSSSNHLLFYPPKSELLAAAINFFYHWNDAHNSSIYFCSWCARSLTDMSNSEKASRT